MAWLSDIVRYDQENSVHTERNLDYFLRTSNYHRLVKCVRSLGQRDSKLLHEIEASGQPVQDGAQTLKSRSIQKEATRIVCVLPTSNAITRWSMDVKYKFRAFEINILNFQLL